MNLSTAVRLAAGFAAICLLTACAASSPVSEKLDLNGTAWILSSLPTQLLLAETTPTLRFEGGRVSGTDGCNRYTAPYTVTGASLEVKPMGASTQMACPPQVMKQATAFMSALTQARTYRVTAGKLELLTAEGTVVATLAAQSQSLAGTAWNVTGYNNGKQAVVSARFEGDRLELRTAEDQLAVTLTEAAAG